MKISSYILPLILLLTTPEAISQPQEKPMDAAEVRKSIMHYDSLFWEAYNKCDVDKMASLFTDDLEFYHDRGGLTQPKAKLMESMKDGLCGNPNWRLRREAIAGTVKVFPINYYGGLISGEHIFFINEKGKDEFLDGYGKFTQVWQYKDNEWKMSRVLSYDHGPPPYVNRRKETSLPKEVLTKLEGKYQSLSSGIFTIIASGGTLLLLYISGEAHHVLYPESESIFFLKDKDMLFEFVHDTKRSIKMITIKNDTKVDEATRIHLLTSK